jgi:glycosyltransferase involved in cell wall biosynthesis
MRICMVGKFPPIQGGVGVRTYWNAHDLAARGHEVHVVTNAKEAALPFRMHMRRRDWKQCEGTYEAPCGSASPGSVKVHWTDPIDRSQYHIPLASPFVSKLAATAARVHSERPFDVIYSHYLEPYGIAGHLAGEITHVPHVVRMAGSDAGRLWRHPQLEALYDHVLRSAAVVIATGMVAGRAIKHGVRPERIAGAGGFAIRQDLFCRDGPKLDLASLREELELDEPELSDALWGGLPEGLPFLGIYGKLGDTKGSFALLAAMKELKEAGLDVGLVAMAHGWPAVEGRFRARAKELGLADLVLQIPFVPHWRVPEFLRSCLAVCCLEQNFPIEFHTPIIAREVLMSGTCLIASTEMIRKLPDHERLPDGYGCVAIPDVHDARALSARIAAIIRDPEPIAAITARGQAFARALQTNDQSCDKLERLLKMAARRRSPSKKRNSQTREASSPANTRFAASHAAARLLEETYSSSPIDLPQARNVLAAVEQRISAGDLSLRDTASAIRLEIAIAEAENDASANPAEELDPLFRLRIKRWAMLDDDLPRLIPVRDPLLRMTTFDAWDLADSRPKRGNPAKLHQRCVVAFAQANGTRRDAFIVGEGTARILQLSDGTRTTHEIAADIDARNPDQTEPRGLQHIQELFLAGLLWLHEGSIDPAEADQASHLDDDRKTLAIDQAEGCDRIVAQRGESNS